jgi:streptogramin lyase
LFSSMFAATANAADIAGQVMGAGAPIAESSVTLYAAGAGDPQQLGQARTGADGLFSISTPSMPSNSVLYLVAKGGRPTANATTGENAAIALITAVGAQPPARVTINEMTTIATVWTHNQFIDGTVIRGTPLGLRIAAGNVPNFVDLTTGGYGATIQDPLNSAQTPTMANFATWASVVAACVKQLATDSCTRLFAASTPPTGAVPTDTLAAVQSIVRYPGYQPARMFALLDAFYPAPKGKLLRPTPFMPYLTFAPSAWVLPLKFTGGGYSGGGKLMFDSQGNVWVGNNFIVGAQNQSTLWAGTITKFAPDGRALSPITTGFSGGGLLGVGFGLAIDAKDHVWPDTYAGRAVTQFDPSGKPLSPPDGYNFDGQLGEMQGIIVAPNGDIWALDQGKSQLLHLPGADPAKGRIYCQNPSKDPLKNPCGLSAPFHLAIDQQERIWITNNIGHEVVRFHVSDPTKVEKFEVGFGGSGLAVDSQGNVWVANRLGSSIRARLKLDEIIAAYLIKGEKTATEVLVRALSAQKPGYEEGGSLTVLRPDGSQAPFSPVVGKGIAGPWAVAIDGNDNVWVSNLVSDSTGIVQLCGVRAQTCPPGVKTGDAISPPSGYVGGGMQQLVDIGVGPAGDVWVSNNWQNDDAAFGLAPEALSTLAGGQGVVVFHGMAKPVKTPLIGPARAP